MLAATGRGFWCPEQQGLLAGYVARFYAAAIDLAHRRGDVIAEVLGTDAYPHYAVDHETLTTAQQDLHHDSPTSAIRRHLDDRLDDLRRAVHV